MLPGGKIPSASIIIFIQTTSLHQLPDSLLRAVLRSYELFFIGWDQGRATEQTTVRAGSF